MEVYLKSGPMTQTEQIPLEEEMFETVMLGTRLRQGVDLAAFERRFGISLSQAYPKAVPACLARGWVFCPNATGMVLAKRRIAAFYGTAMKDRHLIAGG